LVHFIFFAAFLFAGGTFYSLQSVAAEEPKKNSDQLVTAPSSGPVSTPAEDVAAKNTDSPATKVTDAGENPAEKSKVSPEKPEDKASGSKSAKKAVRGKTEKPAEERPQPKLRATPVNPPDYTPAPSATVPELPGVAMPNQPLQLNVPPVDTLFPGNLIIPSNPRPPQSGTGQRSDGGMQGGLPEAILPERKIYKITKFVLKYGTDVRKRNPNLPSESDLGKTPVSLIQKDGKLYHPPGKGESPTDAKPDPALPITPAEAPVTSPEPATTTSGKKRKNSRGKEPKAEAPLQVKAPVSTPPIPVQITVGNLGTPREFSGAALQDVYNEIVKRLNKEGLIGVYLLTTVEPGRGVDSRAGRTEEVEVQIYVSEVAKVRTIARLIPFKVGSLPKINDDDSAGGKSLKDPKHLWIKTKSPLKEGGLLEKRPLQDYLSRLNRFPGRRVDSAINASSDSGKVIVDYLIKEQKPLFAYYQAQNNGTESTGVWRHRVGVEYKQLLNSDDLLRLEYITTDFQRYNSAFFSYEIALVKPDYLKLRPYASYGQYSAQDVGIDLQDFSGKNLSAGLALTWTPFYWRAFPFDISVGAEWFNVTTENSQFGGEASGAFILPFVGFGTERVTDRFSFSANAELQTSVQGPSRQELDGLGRFNAADKFWIGKGGFTGSFYIEPLVLGKKKWGDTGEKGEHWRRAALVHEVAFSVRGQYVAEDKRLVPSLEFIAGGNNTVRGYPESFTAGDTGYAATAEYRLHLARLFRPTGVTATAKPKKKGSKPTDAPPAQPAAVESAAPGRGVSQAKFGFRPQQLGGNADWDVIFRAFADYGQTFNNEFQIATDADRTLLGVGAGLEFQFFKPLFFSVRLDYGIALLEQLDNLNDPVQKGDSRIHLTGTMAW